MTPLELAFQKPNLLSFWLEILQLYSRVAKGALDHHNYFPEKIASG